MEFKKEINSLNNDYTKIIVKLKNRIKEIQTIRDEFPVKASSEEVNFEDFMLTAANCKHEAIKILRESILYYQSICSDYDYFEASIRLGHADTALRDFGFSKITDSLRDAFVKSNEEVRNLLKCKGAIKSLYDTSEKLVKAFECDETDYRKILDIKNRNIGL